MQDVVIIRGPIGAGKSTTMNMAVQGLPNHSTIEMDALKRMIDRTASSEWRREVALHSALYMGRSLLARGHSFITEVHSRWQNHSYEFLKLADCFENVRLHHILVTAPYEICLERTKSRLVPDIDYTIDERMVADYYTSLTPLPNETVIDTAVVGPVEAGRLVVKAVANYGLGG